MISCISHKSEVLQRELLNKIIGDKALNILFLLDQNNKRNYTSVTIQVDEIVKPMFECVDRFAQGRILANAKNETQWITNKVENAVTERNLLSHNWVTSPTIFKHDAYRKKAAQFGNIYLMKCKREAIFQKTWNEPIH